MRRSDYEPADSKDHQYIKPIGDSGDQSSFGVPLLGREEQKILEKVEDEVDLYVARKSQKNVRLSMALNLTEKQILRSHKCWPTFLTIIGYLLSEQSKKARSF